MVDSMAYWPTSGKIPSHFLTTAMEWDGSITTNRKTPSILLQRRRQFFQSALSCDGSITKDSVSSFPAVRYWTIARSLQALTFFRPPRPGDLVADRFRTKGRVISFLKNGKSSNHSTPKHTIQ